MKKRHITKKLFIIAFPIMLQLLAQFILSFTDTAFIGNYKTEGLSAITNAVFPYLMFLTFFFAISQGTTILIAQNLGAKKNSFAKRYTETAFFFNQILSFIYFVFWMLCGKYILILMGVKDDTLNMSWSYIRIISFYFLFFGVSLSCSSIFEGIGRTMPILITTVIRVVINIFLNWILIFGKWGFPELGIEGAAYATLISQFIGTLVFIFMAFNFNHEYKIKLKGIFRPRIKIYFKALKLGIPTGFEYLLFMSGQTLLVYMLNKINNLYAGIFGVFNILIQFSFYVYLSIAQASLNLTGKATGAKKWHEGHLTGNLSLVYSIIICIIFGLFYFLFPKNLMSIFMDDSEVINRYYKYLYLVAVNAFPKSINVIVGSSIRGYGNTKWMLYTQIPGTIIKILLAYYFIFILNLGLGGVLIAILIDEGWRAVVNYIKYNKIFNNAKKSVV